MALFKMSFFCADSIGASRVGVAVTDQHENWSHAEKDLVRACRTVNGYRGHGDVVMVSPADGVQGKLKGDGSVLLDYVGEDGKKVSDLVYPGAEDMSAPVTEAAALDGVHT